LAQLFPILIFFLYLVVAPPRHQLEHIVRDFVEVQNQAMVVPSQIKKEAIARLAAYICRVNEKTPDQRLLAEYTFGHTPRHRRGGEYWCSGAA
jgi:hypothetical protein